MWKSFASFVLTAAIVTGLAPGSGDFAPDRWLANGGIASEMSPEFFWELELRRMAKEFSAPEKRIVPDGPRPEYGADLPPGELPAGAKFTGQGDVKDFHDAITTGRIKPPDVAKAKSQHEAARLAVSTATPEKGEPLPEEFASEFSDYHRGAFAFRRGAAHFEEARLAWKAVLECPKEQRHYRSVWAAFMLGKLSLKQKNPDAVEWFRQTRSLAKEGFADSLGLAADSYGWEGRSELKQGHAEAAAKLYLTQLALGDDSAIVSLKAVIPDRPRVEELVNYGEEPPENATPEQRTKWEQEQELSIQKRLTDAARSPLLRRLITAHVLATETQAGIWSYGAGGNDAVPAPRERCLRWLATIEKSGLKQLDDADHLGWVAYTAGRYEEAARWLKVAPAETATSSWLQAKLLRRQGKLREAAEFMAKALKLVRAEPNTFGQTEFSTVLPNYTPDQSAAGDLAGLHLTRGEFVSAMAVFLEGNLWEDAAFLGDRVLTVEELKKYVDDHLPELAPPPNTEPGNDSSTNTRVRWMLARRLVRVDRYAEARPYFPKDQRAVLDRYVAALKDGDNLKLPKTQRARGIFTAAWIARYDGMELMGAEVEPDGFVSGGNFPPGNLDTERAEGVRLTGEDDRLQRAPVKFAIPATAGEKKRIVQMQPHPSKRFHYRYVAAALAWKAAGLLPDGTEELADVLNTGGGWIKDRDETLADKYYQALERRCVGTKIRKAAAAQHWFVNDLSGPWSASLIREREGNAGR
ncbi:MAG: hypothetical protein WCF18_12365 [Chthoniobacteraceae bacterium]